MRTHIRLTLSLFGALAAGTAAAHHGWSWYGDEEFTLSGTVVEKHFGNPHDRLTVEADGQRWNLVLSPPRGTARSGFGTDKVELGDTVTAFGHRHGDAATLEMKTERIRVGEALYDLYPNRT
jgi:hypothetical protein